MAHDLAFAGAARPTPVVILGLPLLPYSLGHELTLASQLNPVLAEPSAFATLDPMDQAVALTRAAYICACTWKELNPGPFTFRGWFRTWRFTRAWHWKQFGVLGKKRPNYAVEAVKMASYRHDGMTFPEEADPAIVKIARHLAGGDKEDGAPGRMLGGPHNARLLLFLIEGGLYTELGYSTPYDVPYGFANYLYRVKLEEAGRANIENAHERELAEKLSALKDEKPEPETCLLP